MTSVRSYSSGLSVEKALHEVKNNIGLQFDPEIATLFIKLVRDGVINPSVIKHKYSAPANAAHLEKEIAFGKV